MKLALSGMAWNAIIGKALREKKIAEILAKLDFATLIEVYSHMSSKKARRQAAVEVLVQACIKRGIEMDDEQAGMLIDSLTRIIKGISD